MPRARQGSREPLRGFFDESGEQVVRNLETFCHLEIEPEIYQQVTERTGRLLSIMKHNIMQSPDDSRRVATIGLTSERSRHACSLPILPTTIVVPVFQSSKHRQKPAALDL